MLHCIFRAGGMEDTCRTQEKMKVEEMTRALDNVDPDTEIYLLWDDGQYNTEPIPVEKVNLTYTTGGTLKVIIE